MAREAAEATVAASYERGVRDTEARLTEKVAVVCRDYVTESWGVALDQAAVPADSDLRRIENIFFLKDIEEIPSSDPLQEPPSALNTVFDPTTLERRDGDKEV